MCGLSQRGLSAGILLRFLRRNRTIGTADHSAESAIPLIFTLFLLLMRGGILKGAYYNHAVCESAHR